MLPAWSQMKSSRKRGTVFARRLVESRHVRFDAVLIVEPAEHLGRTAGVVTDELARTEMELFERALNHAIGGQYLRLPDCGGRLDIDHDGVLIID
jgi:hypothetical protein